MPKLPAIPVRPELALYLGIDPGQSGGAVLLSPSGMLLEGLPFKNSSDHLIANWLSPYKHRILKAAIESVHAMPGQGVSSMFTFGKSCGFLRGLLVAFQIPFVEVQPQKWMKALSIPPKKDKKKTEHKRVLQAKAHQLWPKQAAQITLAVADAALIAEWLRLEGGSSA